MGERRRSGARRPSGGRAKLPRVERLATEWNEQHYLEVDAALLFLDSTARLDKAIATLRAESAAPLG